MCDELGEKMGNERWSLKDRMFQLKGILDLYDRNKKWSESLTKETAKKRTKEIRELAETERIIREAVQTFKEGDLEGVNMLLRQDPILESLCRGKSLEDCEETAKQLIFLRRKELDSLVFELQQKEEDYLQNQYKLEVLKLPPKFDIQKPSYVYRAQEIEAEIENILTRQEAANIVRDSYDKIRKILKKDARCFDHILGALHLDTIVQCQCVIKAMDLGQVAIEDEAALRDKYNKMYKEFKEMEHERDYKLSLIKKRITKARNVHHKLQRSESLTKMFVGGTAARQAGDTYTKKLMVEHDDLKNIMTRLKDSCQVMNPMHIFPRAEQMEKKKYRLWRQIDINNMWVKTEIIRRNHIKSMNESLHHCVTDEAKSWMHDRKQFQDEIKVLEQIRRELKEDEGQEAKTLTEIQLQLTHLQRIVEPIKVGAFKMEVLDSNLKTMERRVSRIGDHEATSTQNSTLNFLELALPAVEQEDGDTQEETRHPALMDVCQLLDVISAKIDIIKTQVGDMEDRGARASSYYREYMSERATYHQTYLPKLDAKTEEETSGAVKAKLPTREEMKEKSKRLVAAIKEKPKPLTGPAIFTIKKHSCY